jgi:membrane protease subunit HflK
VIVDQSGQGVVPYLPLPGLTGKPAPATAAEGTKQ